MKKQTITKLNLYIINDQTYIIIIISKICIIVSKKTNTFWLFIQINNFMFYITIQYWLKTFVDVLIVSIIYQCKN